MKQNLLLLHGALGSSSQMEVLRKRLSFRYAVYSFNFPGHGGASIPNDGITMSLLADSVINFLDANNISETNIFGYSMGGYAALKCTLKNPNRINAIITLGTKFDWSKSSLEIELSKLKEEYLLEKAPNFIEELKELHKPTDWKEVLNITKKIMVNLNQNQAFTNSELKQITNRVCLMIGDSDRMVSIDETNETCSHLNNAEVKVLKNTKHPLDNIELDLVVDSIHSATEYNNKIWL